MNIIIAALISMFIGVASNFLPRSIAVGLMTLAVYVDILFISVIW